MESQKQDTGIGSVSSVSNTQGRDEQEQNIV